MIAKFPIMTLLLFRLQNKTENICSMVIKIGSFSAFSQARHNLSIGKWPLRSDIDKLVSQVYLENHSKYII